MSAAPETSTSLATDAGLREGYADVGDDVRLHYVEAGDGPLVVLLHGFPEFWYGWRLQIAPLAAAGYRVVAVLDAAHPRKLSEGLRHPSQLERSWYFFYFQLPGIPEHHVRAKDWQFLQGLPARRPTALHAAGARGLRRGLV